MENILKLSIEIDFSDTIKTSDSDFTHYTITDWENHFKNIVKEQLEIEVESWGANIIITDEKGKEI